MAKNNVSKQKIHKAVSPEVVPFDDEERGLMESVERGEWRSVKNRDKEMASVRLRARATFRKDQRMNIRIAGRDLAALKARALAEGVPYQTLVTSIIHKYVEGRLTEGRSARFKSLSR